MKKRYYRLDNQKIYLPDNEIHIWSIDLNEILISKEKLISILSDEESERADKFHFEKDKNWFICSRGLLRILVSAYSELSPGSIEITLSDSGKPFLSPLQNKIGLNFNLSHSKNFMSVGFVKDAHIGVDIELMKPLKNHLEIAKRFFSEAEIKRLNELSNDKIAEGFYTCWTAKESVIKLSGEGLSYPLKEFAVEIREIDVGDSYNMTVELKRKKENLFVDVFRLRQDLFGACAVDESNRSLVHCCLENEGTINFLIR